ncbi:heavy metal translocating P-type ATPase [Amaricoccus macauensis]|uniref:heavy metal translocating P-type ATPase n=1 Tax=Amaricoccus macauensis TaxID=57001 RepID=UPI003C7C2AAF
MTNTPTFPGTGGCPACVAVRDLPHGMAESGPDGIASLRRFEISLPAIHCAACIVGVERTLEATPGVAAARVNLTRKRASVTADDVPGMSEQLIEALTTRGFEAHPLDSAALDATRRDAESRSLLARMGVAGFALMNVMLLSISVWSGAADTTRDLMHWVSAAIALPATLFAAQPFLSNAVGALRGGRLDMDVPISTAILLALGVSLWETTQSGEHAFFDAALMLTFFLLVGRYLALVTRGSARSAAAEVAALEVRTAERIKKDGELETVPLDALREDDVVAIAPGGRVPADGCVIAGETEVDRSMLTGETMPERVAPGTRLHAGMLNLSGPIRLRVEALGEETLLHQIARLVETAEQSRGRYASLASRASQYYSHTVNLLALSALLTWGFIGGDWRVALNIAAAVLIITCPCALGLAVPAVLTAASGRLYRRGILLKDGEALERLGQVDTVVFDKTGTLTTGAPRLMEQEGLPTEAMKVAAGLAQGSAHPLSKAIMNAARNRGISPAPLEDVVEEPGHGTRAILGGIPVRLGRAEWVGNTAPPERTTTWLAIGDATPLPFTFEDELRPEAADTVSKLKDAGLSVQLLSGDSEAPVRDAAQAAGIPQWTALATPSSKVALLQKLAGEGRKVLMIGDGLNDAAALAAAHVSISPASAVDASRTAADLILLGDRIDGAVHAVRLARVARRRILENFGLAFAYNIVTVPIAYAGYVTPLIAAIAMSASSIIVSLNATRLGKEQPSEHPRGPDTGVAVSGWNRSSGLSLDAAHGPV